MKIEHIGIAVNNLEEAVQKFQGIFPDLEVVYETSKDSSMRMAFIFFDNLKIELIQPLNEKSAVGGFLRKRGEGLHHIAVEVPDICQSIRDAKACEIRMVDEEPKEGAGGHLISFVHPKDFHGILLEFCQTNCLQE